VVLTGTERTDRRLDPFHMPELQQRRALRREPRIADKPPVEEGKMQGDARVIEELNARLAEELTAINQYFVHAEMCEDWHYGRLAAAIKKRSITEMKHAEKLIERVLYLDGRPIVNHLNEVHVGALVPDMHSNDLAAELAGVKAYNASIRVCVEARDEGTKEMLESILVDEEEHVDWLEAQITQIEQMGREVYLAEQMD
jgi:bacterioferritin